MKGVPGGNVNPKFKCVVISPAAYGLLDKMAVLSNRTRRDLLSGIIEKFWNKYGHEFEASCKQINAMVLRG
jgi:hypothetical protein